LAAEPKFTSKSISSTVPEENPIWIRSERVPGLCLKISKIKKKWVYERRLDGTHFKISLGDFPAVKYIQAKSAAEKISAALSESGTIPAEFYKLKDLWNFYFSRHGHLKKSIREDQRLYNQFFSAWSSLPLLQITRRRVSILHNEIGLKAPYAANRMLALLRSMFNRCIEWGLLDAGTNPCAGIKKFREKRRRRYLSADEVPLFLKALAEEPNPLWRGFFLLSLILGQRKSELLAMQWNQIHWESGLWRIPDTKSGTPHEVPLPDAALEILKAIAKNSIFVFPGKGKSGHLANPYKAWAQIVRRAGAPDLRIHDLRRSLATWLLAQGESLSMIQSLLNHQSQRTTEIYIAQPTAPLRSALAKSSAIFLALEKKANEKIAPIIKRRSQ